MTGRASLFPTYKSYKIYILTSMKYLFIRACLGGGVSPDFFFPLLNFSINHIIETAGTRGFWQCVIWYTSKVFSAFWDFCFIGFLRKILCKICDVSSFGKAKRPIVKGQGYESHYRRFFVYLHIDFLTTGTRGFWQCLICYTSKVFSAFWDFFCFFIQFNV